MVQSILTESSIQSKSPVKNEIFYERKAETDKDLQDIMSGLKNITQGKIGGDFNLQNFKHEIRGKKPPDKDLNIEEDLQKEQDIILENSINEEIESVSSTDDIQKNPESEDSKLAFHYP